MPVYARLSKNNNQKSTQYGKWYGRAVHLGTIDTDGIAELVQRNCSMKKSDVKAVIEEMIEVMTDALQSSKRVKLNGFGTFKLGIVTKPADTAAEFTISENVVNSKVLFQPQLKISSDGVRTKTFLAGVKVELLPDNGAEEEETESEG